MSDIFISYSRKDTPFAELLAKALTAQGWSVWWDPQILPGEQFHDVIQGQLESANCVVVLWSVTSVKSRWVRDEADVGLKKNNLIPVLIEQAQVPLGFRAIEAAKLVGWKGETNNPEFQILKTAIQKKASPWFPSELSLQTPLLQGLPKGKTRLQDLLTSQNANSEGSRPKGLALKFGDLDLSSLVQRAPKTGILLEDHFKDNSNGWSEKRDHQQILMRIRNGQYCLEHKGPGSWFTWKDIPVDQSRDFEIATEIVHYYASTHNTVPYYGLTWGGSGLDNLFALLFSYDGQFTYQKCVANQWLTVIPWRRCYGFSQLHALEARNKIVIKKRSKLVEFRVNDTWLEDADFEPCFGNNIGFAIWHDFTIAVEFIKVTQS